MTGWDIAGIDSSAVEPVIEGEMTNTESELASLPASKLRGKFECTSRRGVFPRLARNQSRTPREPIATGVSAIQTIWVWAFCSGGESIETGSVLPSEST